MDKKLYLSIGEFAKIAVVSKHTLYHYDEIGLFSPSIKLENGYRYYSVYQFEAFNAIWTLKELGMSLRDIKTYLEQRSSEKLQGLLLDQESYIDKKIERLLHSKKWLHEKLNVLNKLDTLEIDKIYEQKLQAQYYISGYAKTTDDISIPLQIGKLLQQMEAAGIENYYQIGYIQEMKHIKAGLYNECQEVYLQIEKTKKLKFMVREEGNYLTASHKGDWENIGEAYERLLAYALHKSLTLGNQFYETYLCDELVASGTKNQIINIEVRILS